jgi:hypothetical protein
MAMERIAFESPGGRPIIATIGGVFREDEIVLMERAADELNIAEEVPRYRLVIESDSSFGANGRRLPRHSFRVKVQGSWVEDKDLGPLWDRVEELRAELGS